MRILQTRPFADGLALAADEGELYLMPVRENIIRCVYTKRGAPSAPSPLVEAREPLLPKPAETEESAAEIRFSAGRLSALVDKEAGTLCWMDEKTGTLRLREGGRELTETDLVKYVPGGSDVIDKVQTVDGERQFVGNLAPVFDRKAYRAKLRFEWKEEEAIYGLGQGEEGIFNYRGHIQYLYQHNMRIPIPFFLSSEKYAVFFDCASLMTFNDDPNGSYIFMDAVEQLDYYVILGENFDELVAGFRSLTGRAAMLPKWSFGYIQSKEAYRTQEELVETVREYRRRNVPLDCVVQDWNYWEAGCWGQKTPDPKRYPALKEAVDRIHGMHAKAMISVWPNMGTETEDAQEFARRGLLLADRSTYDAFSEEARELYWGQLKRELYPDGFDAWWCDSTEPFSGPDWNGETKREPWERFLLVGGEHKKFLGAERANAYALAHTEGLYEHLRAVDSKRRVLILTRLGYPSQQKYGSVLWSGDTCATWKNFRTQITEGLNFCMSGMPYWTLDIGGFFTVGSAWRNRGCGSGGRPNPLWFWKGDYNGGVRDLGYRELYVRWFQFALFLPMFRAHGTDTPREIWNFGEKGEPFYSALEACIRLRYLWMPYLYSLAAKTVREHYTMLRSLMFDFSEDRNVRNISDEFMFGSAFLVCPVTKPMYYDKENKPLHTPKERDCYLPAGADWTDYWTGRRYPGGETVRVPAPLAKIPLFVRCGSVVPMAEGLQYAEEPPRGPVILKVYPGADAAFTLYEDSGDGYEYEKGEYSTISMRWCEQKGELFIGKSSGFYEGMPQTRTFLVVAGKTEKEVEYDGGEQNVAMRG